MSEKIVIGTIFILIDTISSNIIPLNQQYQDCNMMTLEQFILFFTFVTVMVGTPGPANMCLLASGMAVGRLRSLPLMVGIIAGFQLVLILNAAGMYALLTAAPQLLNALKILSFLYICYLAYKVATSSQVAKGKQLTQGQIVSDFIRGFWVHPLNPKAYAIVFSVLTQFVVPDSGLYQYMIIIVTFIIWGGVLHFLWISSGSLFSNLVKKPVYHRMVSVVLAVLMVASVGTSLFYLDSI